MHKLKLKPERYVCMHFYMAGMVLFQLSHNLKQNQLKVNEKKSSYLAHGNSYFVCGT